MFTDVNKSQFAEQGVGGRGGGDRRDMTERRMIGPIESEGIGSGYIVVRDAQCLYSGNDCDQETFPEPSARAQLKDTPRPPGDSPRGSVRQL
jgi:hypothetical protein